MTRTFDRNSVVEIIGNVISPYVGDAMGQTSGNFYCKRLGFTEATLNSAELEQLLEELGKGLKVFLGVGKSEAVTAEVRKAVSKGEVR